MRCEPRDVDDTRCVRLWLWFFILAALQIVLVLQLVNCRQTMTVDKQCWPFLMFAASLIALLELVLCVLAVRAMYLAGVEESQVRLDQVMDWSPPVSIAIDASSRIV